jgi:SAF domain
MASSPTSLNQPLSQALNPKKSNLLPALLLVLGLIIALSAAAYGYLESRRTEAVLIAVRDVPFGQQITADDLGTIELPLHRPTQVTGIGDPALVIGKWAGRQIGQSDLLQPSMLLDTAPDQPVYPSGQKLDKDTVPVPFSTTTIGPLTFHDLVNIGYNVTSGDPQLCLSNGGTVQTTVPVSAPTSGDDQAQARPFACRLLQRVKVLYVDDGKGVAYLQLTPYQSHVIWALQAAGVSMWGERYGASSDELPAMDRLDAGQVDLARLTMTLSDTLKLYNPQGMGGGIPGATTIPGQTTSTLGQPESAAPTPVEQK